MIDWTTVSDQELLDELKKRTEQEGRIGNAMRISEWFGKSKQHISHEAGLNNLKNTKVYNAVYITREDAREFFKLPRES